ARPARLRDGYPVAHVPPARGHGRGAPCPLRLRGGGGGGAGLRVGVPGGRGRGARGEPAAAGGGGTAGRAGTAGRGDAGGGVMEVLFLQKPEVLAVQRPQVEAALAALGGVAVRFAGTPEEAHRHPGAEVVIAPTLPWLPDALTGLPTVRWVHFLSAGVDRIWAMPLDWGRYRLSKSVGVHAATISEYVLGAVLYVLKGFGTFARQQRRREWRRFWLDECAGKTLGIVGIGTIGARLAEHAKALGMTVIGTVTTPRAIPHVDAVFASEELERVLEASDFVVLLVPLTDETRGLIG